MSPPPRNVAASVHARLLARSRQRGEDFQFVLQRYGAERFLYRLGESTHRDRFVLKGAMLFALWGGSVYRPTRDLDFTGYGSSETEAVLACFREICALAIQDDGLIFDALTLAAEPIRDDAEYDGLRVKLLATLGQARIHMQIDVGFGNVIEPPATEVEYPTLLDAPAPRIHAYPQEAVVAEKLHAMALFGERNSRLKDFYDLYVLAKEFRFEGHRLAGAISATFKRRRTLIDAAQPAALAPRFFSDEARAAQWRSYMDRNRLPGPPADFDAVGELIRAFLGPPWSAIAENAAFGSSWQPGGPWEPEEARLLSAATLSPRGHRSELEPRAARPEGGVVSGAIEARAVMPLRRFKPYPEYKDCGVEWLGEIPTHWEVARVADHTELMNGYPFDSERFSLDEGMPLVRIRDISSEDTEIRYVGPPVRAALIGNGDILIGMDGEFNVGRWRGGDALLNQRMCCLRPLDSVDGQYLLHTMPFPLKVINDLTYSTTVKHLSSHDVTKTRLPFPPVTEQRAIAAFLDRETAKIDALVAQKERLIELLQEKRTALITQAVTKGLDPDAPMKDSGVEVLGEIPAHWRVRRLWHLTPTRRQIMYGIVLPGPNVDEGVPIIKGGDVSAERLRLDLLNRTTFEIEAGYIRSRVQGGDLVFAIRGSIGEVEMVPEALTGANITQDAARVAYTAETHGEWLLYALKSTAVFSQLEAGALGATIKGINIRDLKRARVPVPPRPEQVAIAEFLNMKTRRLDALAQRVNNAIEGLKELRTALISAAVTGKIDVRAA